MLSFSGIIAWKPSKEEKNTRRLQPPGRDWTCPPHAAGFFTMPGLDPAKLTPTLTLLWDWSGSLPSWGAARILQVRSRIIPGWAINDIDIGTNQGCSVIILTGCLVLSDQHEPLQPCWSQYPFCRLMVTFSLSLFPFLFLFCVSIFGTTCRSLFSKNLFKN